MASFVKTYTLTCHTPLIHFQHDQAGAVLRASEVKPKLDKYLLGKLGGIKKAKNDHPKWFVGETAALNYKLRFEAIGKIEKTESIREAIGKIDDKNYRVPGGNGKIPGMYYGNMVNEKKAELIKETYKEAIFYKGGIEITVICIQGDLREFIDKHVASFFLCTNFGTASGKGYGSFTVKSAVCDNNAVCKSLCDRYGANACYYYEIAGDYKKALDSVKTVYGIMKSGLNLGPGRYRRSLLFNYMHERFGIGNEKAGMKQAGIAPTDVGKHYGKHHKNGTDEKTYYVRALLGVGDTQSWLFNRRDRDGKYQYTIKKNGERVIATDRKSITVNSETDRNQNKIIERFPSPVFFKIIYNVYTSKCTVFFVGSRINNVIFGKKFTFKSSMGSRTWSVPDSSAKDADGNPIDSNFMDGFLDYCHKKWDNPPIGECKLSSFFAVNNRNGFGQTVQPNVIKIEKWQDRSVK